MSNPEAIAKTIYNVDQLRSAIDRGETGDKVAASDPAAAPLGTDEEAAGTPVPRAALREAFAQETSHVSKAPEAKGKGLWLLAGTILLVIGGVAIVLVRAG